VEGVAHVKGEGVTAEIEVLAVAVLPRSSSMKSRATDDVQKAGAQELPSGLGAQKIVALVSGGVGVVGLAVGTVFAVKAMRNKSDADQACTGNTCSTDAGVTAGNDAHAAGNVATIGMVVGAVGLAGGLARWFTAPKEERAVQAGLGLPAAAVSCAFSVSVATPARATETARLLGGV
jgi:hypothetical protein